MYLLYFIASEIIYKSHHHVAVLQRTSTQQSRFKDRLRNNLTKKARQALNLTSFYALD